MKGTVQQCLSANHEGPVFVASLDDETGSQTCLSEGWEHKDLSAAVVGVYNKLVAKGEASIRIEIQGWGTNGAQK